MFRFLRAVALATVLALVVSIVPSVAATASASAGMDAAEDELPVNQLPDTVYMPPDELPDIPQPEASPPPPADSPLGQRIAEIEGERAEELADIEARESDLSVAPEVILPTLETSPPGSAQEIFGEDVPREEDSVGEGVVPVPEPAETEVPADPEPDPTPTVSSPAPEDSSPAAQLPNVEPGALWTSGSRAIVRSLSFVPRTENVIPQTGRVVPSSRGVPASVPAGSACFPGDNPLYDATVEVLGVAQAITNTRAGAVTIKVTNRGSSAWPSGTTIAYQIYDMAENRIGGRGSETSLGDLASNHWKSLDAAVGPVAPGSWYLMWDINVPGTGWLTDRGVCPLSTLSVQNQAPSIELVRPSLVDTVATTTPSLGVRGIDSDLWPSPSRLTYEFKVCSDAALSSNCTSSGWIDSSTWRVPSGLLQWAQTYYWDASVSDGVATTGLRQGLLDPETMRFSVVVPQPEPWRQVGNGLGMANVHGLVLPYGVYVQSVKDAQVNTASLPLYFERTYSSGATGTEGSMGKGWMTILDAKAVRDISTGSVTVTYPDGRQETFGRVGSEYVGATQLGMNNRLEVAVSGETTVTQQSGEVVHYDSAGRLSKIDYPGTGSWEVAYTKGLASKIVQQPSGVALGVNWSRVDDTCGSERATRPYVTSVSLDTGDGRAPATWEYGYYCSRLKYVWDPSGAVTRYAADDYLLASHRNFLKVTSPEGRELPGIARVEGWKSVGSSYRERVFTLTEPGSATRTIRLLAPPSSGSTEYYRSVYNSLGGVTVEYCETYRHVVNGNEECYGYYDTMRFDVEGRLRYTQKAFASPSQARYWSYGRDGKLVAVLDENGNVLSFSYDGWGNLSSSWTFRDAQTQITASTVYHDFSPDRSGALTRPTGVMYSPNVAAVPLADYINMFFYDDEGRLVRRQGPATPGAPNGESVTYAYTDGTEQAIDGAGSPIAGATIPAGLIRSQQTGAATLTYGYDAQGRLTQYFDGAREWTRSYDSRGLLTREKPADGGPGERSYTYDVLGRLTGERDVCAWDAQLRVSARAGIDYEYDRDGLLLRRSERALQCDGSADVLPARVTTFDYNRYSQLTRSTDPAGGVTEYAYAPEDPTKVASMRDARGRLTSFTYWLGQLDTVRADVGQPGSGAQAMVASYMYDSAGRVTFAGDAARRYTFYDYTGDDLAYAARRIVGTSATGSNIFATVWEREYDGAGRITKEIAGSRRETFQYDSEGRLFESVLDPDGLNRRVATFRDAAGRVVSMVRSDESRQERTSYESDSLGRVLATHVWLDPTHALTTLTRRNASGEISLVRDPRGAAVAWDSGYDTQRDYDELGRLSTVAGPPILVDEPRNPVSTDDTAFAGAGPLRNWDPPISKTYYNAFGDVVITQDPQDHETSYDYDSAGRRIAEHKPEYTSPDGQVIRPVIRYEYNSAGDLVRMTDERGGITDYEYDVAGNLVKETGPEVSWLVRPVTTFTYDAANQLTSRTSPSGAVTKYAYDVFGRVVAVTQRERGQSSIADYTTSYSYNLAGDLTSITTPAGRVTRFDRNAAGEATAIWYPGRTQPDRFEYDVAGRVTLETDGAGRKIEHVFDLAGRETSTTRVGTDGSRLTTTNEYDEAGNLIATTNPRGVTTTYAVNALNLRTSVTQPVTSTKSIIIEAGYDIAGNRVRTRNGEGVDTWTTYNAWNLPEKVVEAPTGAHPLLADRSWTYSYDASGNQVTELKPGQVRVTREFDALGRMTKEEGHHDRDSDPRAVTRSFGFDLDGRVTAADSASSRLQYAWSDRGLLKSAGALGGTQFGYSYDADGLLTARAGTGENFTYDAGGRLSTARGWGAITGNGTAVWSYDAASGDQTGYQTLNTKVAQSYDPQGRVLSIDVSGPGGASLQRTTYSYDADDNVVDKLITGGLFGGGSYSYDLADRLSVWYPRDGDGTSGGIYPRAYSLTDTNALANESIHETDTEWRYDQRGRPISQVTDGAVSTISSDARGEITRIDTVNGPLHETRTMEYDALGQLVDDNGTRHEYDAFGRVVTSDSVGNPGSGLFTYDGFSAEPSSVPSLTTAHSERVYRTPDGSPVGASGPYGSRSLTVDGHGDVTGGVPVSGSGAAVGGQVQFDPFGAVFRGSHPSETGPRQLSTLGFQSDWTNYKTGLSWQGARWYDANLRTFLSRDDTVFPLEGASSLNLYGYGNANPLKYVDPTGRRAEPIPHYDPYLDDGYRAPVTDIGSRIAARDAAAEASWKAALRFGGKIAVRFATRAIPVVGWLLLAWDILELAQILSSPGEPGRGPGRNPSPGPGAGPESPAQSPEVPSPVPPPRPADPTVHFERAGGEVSSGVDPGISGVVSIADGADGSALRPCGLSGTVTSCLAPTEGIVAGCASPSSPMRPCAPAEPIAGVPGSMGPALNTTQELGPATARFPSASQSDGGEPPDGCVPDPALGYGTSSGRWRVGDDVFAKTARGNSPAWSTIRARYWKNEAALPGASEQWGAEQLERMQRGLAPQRWNRDKPGFESKELSHEPTPCRDGGTNFVPRWPQDHAEIDPYRYPGY